MPPALAVPGAGRDARKALVQRVVAQGLPRVCGDRGLGGRGDDVRTIRHQGSVTLPDRSVTPFGGGRGHRTWYRQRGSAELGRPRQNVTRTAAPTGLYNHRRLRQGGDQAIQRERTMPRGDRVRGRVLTDHKAAMLRDVSEHSLMCSGMSPVDACCCDCDRRTAYCQRSTMCGRSNSEGSCRNDSPTRSGQVTGNLGGHMFAVCRRRPASRDRDHAPIGVQGTSAEDPESKRAHIIPVGAGEVKPLEVV